MDRLYPAALPLIPPGEQVLDLGCGIGLLGLLLEARATSRAPMGLENQRKLDSRTNSQMALVNSESW